MSISMDCLGDEAVFRLRKSGNGSQPSLCLRVYAPGETAEDLSALRVRLQAPGFPKGLGCSVIEARRLDSGWWELVLRADSEFEESVIRLKVGAGGLVISDCQVFLEGEEEEAAFRR